MIEWLQNVLNIFHILEIRARYCQIFTAVMKNISEKLGTSEYTKALASFTEEQPNLQKLLSEVKYTKQDTYHFFIEMATKCTELIERYMAGNNLNKRHMANTWA